MQKLSSKAHKHIPSSHTPSTSLTQVPPSLPSVSIKKKHEAGPVEHHPTYSSLASPGPAAYQMLDSDFPPLPPRPTVNDVNTASIYGSAMEKKKKKKSRDSRIRLNAESDHDASALPIQPDAPRVTASTDSTLLASTHAPNTETVGSTKADVAAPPDTPVSTSAPPPYTEVEAPTEVKKKKSRVVSRVVRALGSLVRRKKTRVPDISTTVISPDSAHDSSLQTPDDSTFTITNVPDGDDHDSDCTVVPPRVDVVIEPAHRQSNDSIDREQYELLLAINASLRDSLKHLSDQTSNDHIQSTPKQPSPSCNDQHSLAHSQTSHTSASDSEASSSPSVSSLHTTPSSSDNESDSSSCPASPRRSRPSFGKRRRHSRSPTPRSHRGNRRYRSPSVSPIPFASFSDSRRDKGASHSRTPSSQDRARGRITTNGDRHRHRHRHDNDRVSNHDRHRHHRHDSPRRSVRPGDPAKAAAGIEQFKGADTKDVKDYLRRFDTRMHCLGVSRVRTFVLCCADSVFQALCRHKDKHGRRLNFDTDRPSEWLRIRKTLIKLYHQPSNTVALYAELTHRKQLAGESVGAFSEALQNFGNKLRLSELQLRGYLIQNMNPALRARLPIIKEAQSYRKILANAVYCERYLSQERADNESSAARGSIAALAPVHDDPDAEAENFVAAIGPSNRPPSRFKSPRARPPAASAPSAPGQPSKWPPNDPKHKGLTCSNCNKLNHIAKVCRGPGGGGHIPRVRPQSIAKAPKEGELLSVCSGSGTVLLVPVQLSSLTADSSAPTPLPAPSTVTGMADCGASRTFIRRDVAERLGLPFSPAHVPRHFTIGDEGVLTTTGETHVCIQFTPQVSASSVCLVADKLPFDLIIGNDVWTATDGGIFPGRRHIAFPGGIFVHAESYNPGPYAAAIYDTDDLDPDGSDPFDPTSVIPTLEEMRNPPPPKFPSINPDLPRAQFDELHALITDNLDVFEMPTVGDRQFKTELFRLHLVKDTKPVFVPNRRTPYADKPLVEEVVQELLRRGQIKRSSSSWSSRYLLIHRNGKARFCIDFRELNQHTIPEAFTTTYVWDILENMANAKYLAKEDLTKAFHQFPVHPEDTHMLAFSVDSGHYEYTVLPFGPRNGPAFFNRQMAVMLEGLKDTSSFFDDLATYSKSFSDFIQALKSKFARLREHGIKLDSSKCFYGYTELDILGYHVICGQGTTVQSSKVEGIRNMAVPRNTSDVRKLLGSMVYYSYRVDRFSDIALPLKALLRDDVPFTWGPAQQRAMDTLKSIVTSPKVMAAFNPARMTQLHTDASNIGLGAVLQQVDESGNVVPIAYASRGLTPAESRYVTQQQECLALVFGCDKFFVYLSGIDFEVYTDHQALLNILRSDNPNPRITRWSLYLQVFRMKIHHVKGVLNVVPDALSRLIAPATPTPPHGQLIPLVLPSATSPDFLEPTAWRSAQSEDDFCAYTLRSIKDGSLVDSSFSIVDDLLFVVDLKSGALRLVVPRCLIEAVLFRCHSTPSAGHQGVRRTSSIVHESFFWNGWKGDVTSFVRNCEKCQQYNGGLYNKRSEVTPQLPVTATMFNEKVSLDIAGPFHISDRGNTHTVVIQDKFSHLACVVAIPDTTAETVAHAFVNSWISAYSAPLYIITDNGRNLVGAVMSDVCKILRSHMITTSPYNPKANPVERFNRTMNSMIAKFVNTNQTDWDIYIGLLVSAYNTTSHTSSGASPFSLVFKRPTLTIVEKMQLQVDPELKSLVGVRGRAALQFAYDEALHRQRDRLEVAKQNNSKSDYYPFKVDDYVWMEIIQAPKDGRKLKHMLGHSGPHRVTAVNGPLSYVVEHVRTGAIHRAHHYRLSLVSEKLQLKYASLPRPSLANAATPPAPISPGTSPAITTSASSRPSSRSPPPRTTAATSAHSADVRYPKRANRRIPKRLLTAIQSRAHGRGSSTPEGVML